MADVGSAGGIARWHPADAWRWAVRLHGQLTYDPTFITAGLTLKL